MRIKITSDSTCDLPQELVAQKNISLMPLNVIKNEENFRDGETITPDVIFQHVANGGSLCSTAAVSVGDYEDFFEKNLQGFDALIHINIGSGFSSCYQNACLASEDLGNILVIDSQSLSSGQGMVVLEACRLAQEGKTLSEIKAAMDSFIPRVEISFVLDRLEYMVKGGRCSAAAALGANLLNLKPCIEVKDGKMGVVKKYRGNFQKSLGSYFKDRLENREDLDKGLIFVTHTPVASESVEQGMEAAKAAGFETVLESHAGCTVSCHCGPGTLGVIFLKKA